MGKYFNDTYCTDNIPFKYYWIKYNYAIFSKKWEDIY